MTKITDAVALVLVYQDEVLIVKRQNYLKAFPGYWAFPGGKVDKEDHLNNHLDEVFKSFAPSLVAALIREAKEELGLDFQGILKTDVKSVNLLGLAVTPDFNPYRFATYFFKIELKRKPQLSIDYQEAEFAQWFKAKELLEKFEAGEVLAVPPVIKVIQRLGEDIQLTSIPDLNFVVPEGEVPWIESIKGVIQVMPLSNTLPPATRTNAFIIGDETSQRFLIDPSPRDTSELDRLMKTISRWRIDGIFLTHHHADHHENSVAIAQRLGVPFYSGEWTYHKILKKWGEDYFQGQKVHVVKPYSVLTQWLGHDLVIIPVPGHDKGQLALMPKNKAWFLAGDLFQGTGTVVIGGEGSSMTEYMQTLEQVIKLQPRVVFPSHGIGLGGTNILEKTLEHRKLREQQILDCVRKNKSEEEMLGLLYAEIPSSLKPYALSNIRAHLQKLRDQGDL